MSAESKIAGDRISAAQLAEIEKRANDATPGLWCPLDVGEGKMIALYQDDPSSGAFAYVGANWTDASSDASFIAHARSDVPALVNEIRAAWGEAEAATRALRDLVAAHEQHHNAPGDWDRLEAAIDAAARALVGSENHSEES